MFLPDCVKSRLTSPPHRTGLISLKQPILVGRGTWRCSGTMGSTSEDSHHFLRCISRSRAKIIRALRLVLPLVTSSKLTRSDVYSGPLLSELRPRKGLLDDLDRQVPLKPFAPLLISHDGRRDVSRLPSLPFLFRPAIRSCLLISPGMSIATKFPSLPYRRVNQNSTSTLPNLLKAR